MKTLIERIRYNCLVYLKSNKIILPAISWLTASFMIYSTKPLEKISTVMLSMGILFFTIIWIGYTYLRNTDIVMQDLMILSSKSKNIYYIGNYLTLFLFGSIGALLASVIIFLENVLNGFSLFINSLSLYDIICAFILHIAAVLISISIIALYETIAKLNSKGALLFLILFSILSVVKVDFIEKIPYLKYITYILNALSKITLLFSGINSFPFNSIIKVLIYSAAYCCILISLSLYVLNNKGYK